MVLHCTDLADLDRIAQKTLAFGGDCRTYLFSGDLGAGKTALIKALCKELGVQDETSSPTFAIVNEYRCADGKPAAHMDLYRLKDSEELIDAGLLEYFDDHTYCFVEWPEKFFDLLPLEHVAVNITVEDGTRRFELTR